MRSSNSPLRYVAIACLAVAVVGASGCRWFKKENELYAQSPETRPLEVPPDLDLPRTEGGIALPPTGGSVTRSTTGPAVAGTANGFAVQGERDAVFARVGQALEATDGVTVTSRAQIVGTYDVQYAGSQFLLRVTPAQDGGTFVSAVDPRGQAATGDAPTRLLAAVQAALAD
ncbi:MULTISPECIES: hypothetical protein [Luteimonas]|uniref:hypothetical protein n=1 Tax=Luteimonas TaxID=83614 RepID=UPI000C7E1C36|nr:MULTISPECIES: hypothetical protein [Luteimonas]